MENNKEKTTQENKLPKRKFNSPVSRIVCWKCKRGLNIKLDKEQRKVWNIPGITLHRLRYSNGKKSPDYACQDHVQEGLPKIGNQSEVMFQYSS